MISCRVFRISTIPRGSFGKLCGLSSNPEVKVAFQKNQVFPMNSVSWTQLRTSTFARNSISGGKGLLSQTTPVKKESAISLTRIAYAVKLVRLPFLLVAISSIGYQRGGKLVSELFSKLSP